KADSLDYAASPGADLSSSVVFEEGINVRDAAASSLAEVFSTDVRVNGIPNAVDSGGTVTWSKLAAAGDMGLTDTVADLGLPNFSQMMSYARQLQARKANPQQVTELEVTRTADAADKWRELDYVTVHIPTLGINHQKSQIIGYTYEEEQASQKVWI